MGTGNARLHTEHLCNQVPLTISLLLVSFSSTSIPVIYSKPMCTVYIDPIWRNSSEWLLEWQHPLISMYPLILFICF